MKAPLLRMFGEARARLAAWRARGWSVRDSDSIDVLVALVPSLSLFGLGMLFIAEAALGDRLDLSVFRLATSLLVLPAGVTLLLALPWARRAFAGVLRGVVAAGATLLLMALLSARRAFAVIPRLRRLRAAALIALLAPASLVVVLPPRESAETAFDQGARARTAVASATPAWHSYRPISAGAKPYPSIRAEQEEAEAAPRRGYCLDGAFYDLVADQPDYDPNYRGAVLASVDPSTGAVSCDFPPEEVDSEPKLPRDLAERLAAQREAIATSLEAGDSCAAASHARNLQRAIGAAVQDGPVPDALRDGIEAQALAVSISLECEPPLPPEKPRAAEPKDEDLEEEHEDEHEKDDDEAEDKDEKEDD